MHSDHPLRPTRGARRTNRTWLDARTAALPGVLLVLLVALGAWRADDGRGSDPAPTPGPRLAARTFGQVAVDAPASWQVLDRTEDHVTWGRADRTHTVTLARTESSAVALPRVVREVVAGSAQASQALRAVGAPVELALDRAPRDDSAVLAEFAVGDRGGDELAVAQVWRRDTRAGVDIVATWTSADGRWPASPRDAIPYSTGSR